VVIGVVLLDDVVMAATEVEVVEDTLVLLTGVKVVTTVKVVGDTLTMVLSTSI
jgi:hypothetical protein